MEKFDPDHKYITEYNRYGHVTFKTSSSDKIRFHSPSPDQLFVYIDPTSDILNKLGITHILAVDEEIAVFDNHKKFEKVYIFLNKAIYKVNQK
ncbi:MAG: dual specificity protein phosphatase family protein [Desulfobacteraceae bacterium]|nr:dual specificity protein phosphatase family protein [Desulfobacteraceae bacterium]